MKQILVFVLLCFLVFPVFPQSPEIQAILEKARTGKQLSESEMGQLKQWGEEMTKKMGGTSVPATEEAPEKATIPANTLCPPKIPLNPGPALTRESYIRLAKDLMASYGARSGKEAELKALLASTGKATDGADLGGLFMVAGAGSACIYTTAWSAVQQPDDILTANNLGVALKDMGELAQALRVLKYAESLKPGVGLVLSNLGWVYREAGDYAQAKAMFRKALSVAPDMTSPSLGMGLILNCEGNKQEAAEYLRKALKDRYSAIGIMAYRQTPETGKPGQENGQKPLSDEKGKAEGLQLPELPVYEEPGKMMAQQAILDNYFVKLQSRQRGLAGKLASLSELIVSQQTRAMQNPDNSVVYRRDFAREMMQFGDITTLLFGEVSNYGKALKEANRLRETSSRQVEQHIMPSILQYSEKNLRLQQQLIQLMEKMIACGDNELCKAKVQAEIDAVKAEMERNVFQMCKLNKQQLDIFLSANAKGCGLVANALKEASRDYYAFTDPILERIYAPALNEFYNLYREAVVTVSYQVLAGSLRSVAAAAQEHQELTCIEPEPPKQADPEIEDEIPAKKPRPCPLGENGIRGGIGALSFELSCDHVKLSGGEGLLWSVKRDFKKHETTLWGGVGVKGEYGSGNVTGEASIGVELTIGTNDTIKDVAFTSSVKAGLGGLLEAEISGRFAAEGGPELNADAGFSLPELPSLN